MKGGKVYMYGGAIVGNNARDGGAIFCTSGGEVNIYDGIIAENNAQNGGAIGCVGESKIKYGFWSVYDEIPYSQKLKSLSFLYQ